MIFYKMLYYRIHNLDEETQLTQWLGNLGFHKYAAISMDFFSDFIFCDFHGPILPILCINPADRAFFIHYAYESLKSIKRVPSWKQLVADLVEIALI